MPFHGPKGLLLVLLVSCGEAAKEAAPEPEVAAGAQARLESLKKAWEAAYGFPAGVQAESESDRTIFAEWAAVKALDIRDKRSADASKEESQVKPAEPEPALAASVFAGLATREHRIWLHLGGRCTIQEKDGTVLAREIDDATLARDYPDLHRMVHEAVDVDDAVERFGY